MAVQRLDSSITLGAYAHYVIYRSVERFVQQEEAVLKNKDDEPLHQMRVGMRRLRTAVQVFAPAIALPEAISQASIGKVAKRLGHTRNLDVMYYTLVHRYQPLVSRKESKLFERILKDLKRQRKASGLELQGILHSDRYGQLKHALYDWIDNPTYTAAGQQLLLPLFPDLLLPLICQLFLHPGWLVGTTGSAGKIQLIPLEKTDLLREHLQRHELDLHDLRKQVKRVRYQAEFLTEFDSDFDQSFDQNLDTTTDVSWHIKQNLIGTNRANHSEVSDQTSNQSEAQMNQPEIEQGGEQPIITEAKPHLLTYRAAIAEFKWMQDTLGELQDTFVLQQFLESCLNSRLANQLPSLDRAIQDFKTNFWQTWQPIQQRYLLPEFRYRLRSLFHRPLGIMTPYLSVN